MEVILFPLQLELTYVSVPNISEIISKIKISFNSLDSAILSGSVACRGGRAFVSGVYSVWHTTYEARRWFEQYRAFYNGDCTRLASLSM